MVLYSLLTEVSVGVCSPPVSGQVCCCSSSSPCISAAVLDAARAGPRPPERGTRELGQKLRSLKAVILPILIVVIVLGAIFGGYATPTEAPPRLWRAMVATGVNRQLSWAVIATPPVATLKLTALIMWILFAAHAFSTA